MRIKVSNGELIDKLSILNIKKHKIKDIKQLDNVYREYTYLTKKYNTLLSKLSPESQKDFFMYRNKLYVVNQKLWNIEDNIRYLEKNKDFREQFIQLARSVYITNDERSKIKKQINLITNSSFVEEKSYKEYE
jgi:hypothetical protein